MTLFCAGAAFRTRRTRGTPLRYEKTVERPPRLDIWAMVAMFAQPLGSLSGQMCNIITKLLIAVVPRRIAGGG
jgi:hypothetical protein